MSGVVVVNQPGFYLVDADGNVVTLADGDTIGNAESLLVAGKDGTVARFMAVDSSGKLAIQNPPNLDAALSTLATETKLEAVRALLSTIDADTSNLDVALSTLASESKLESVRALLATIDADTSNLDVALSTLATETKLEAVRALLATIDVDTSNLDVALSTRASEATLSSADGKLATIDAVLDSIKDTDGVKKITDPLPAGTNTLGRSILRDPTDTFDLGDTTNPVETRNVGKRSVSGTITAPGGFVEIDCEDAASVTLQLSGTWVATLAAQYTIDGTNWYALDGYEIGGSAIATVTQENGQFIAQVNGFSKARIIASSFTSGTVNVDAVTNVRSNRVNAQVAQQISKSEANSTSTNLAAGATFTGGIDATRGVQGIGISIESDQPLRVTVQQSLDGTSWGYDQVWNYWPDRGQTTQQFGIQNQFTRVLVKNRGNATTTQLTLETVLIPISNILPRNLTPRGFLQTALKDDDHDRTAAFGAFSTLKTSNESTLGDYRFKSTSEIDDNWTTVSTGAGNYSVVSGKAGVSLTTGAQTSSSIELKTKLRHQYVAGRGMIFKFSAITGDTGVPGNVREWGAYDGTDGFFLRLDGTTLSFVVSNGGTETVINSNQWDVPVDLDANGHLWYIQYQWLGVGDAFLYYDGEVVHRYRHTGTSQEFSTETPDLPAYIKNENTTNSSDVELKVGCCAVDMEGGTVISGVDSAGRVRDLSVSSDGAINVTVVGSVPPEGVDGVSIYADTPLSVGSHDTTYVIPAGETFVLQQFTAGNEDPTKGAKVTILYDDGTEHVIQRGYVAGFTVDFPLPNIDEARDGTPLVGNGTNTIIVRREKLTASNIEIDAVVRGYSQ